MKKAIVSISIISFLLAASTAFLLFIFFQDWQKEKGIFEQRVTQLKTQNEALQKELMQQQNKLEKINNDLYSVSPVSKTSQTVAPVPLGSRIDKLEREASRLRSDIGDLENKVSRPVLGLESQTSSLQGDVSRLSREIFGDNVLLYGNRVSKIKELEDKVSFPGLGLESQTSRLQNDVSSLQSKISDLSTEIFGRRFAVPSLSLSRIDIIEDAVSSLQIDIINLRFRQ